MVSMEETLGAQKYRFLSRTVGLNVTIMEKHLDSFQNTPIEDMRDKYDILMEAGFDPRDGYFREDPELLLRDADIEATMQLRAQSLVKDEEHLAGLEALPYQFDPEQGARFLEQRKKQK